MAEPPPVSSTASTGHLSVMQLFYELKQKFPTAPDPVVSECIRQSGHDPKKCEALLRASCASRGFFPAAGSCSPTSAVVGRRRFSAPPAAGAAAAAVTPPCNVLQSSSSRERSAAGRNSMCALPERTSPTPIEHPPPQHQQQQQSVNTVDSVQGELCDNHSATPSALRAKLRPTFLNTRPFLNNRRNSNPYIDNTSDLRPPFLGGPLQEPHKYNRRRSSTSTTTKEESSEETQEFYTSETYKCSVNTQTRVQDWLPSREPTPPPRPPLPSTMVQEPMLPPPFSSRYFHEEDFFQDYEVSVNCGAHGVHVTSTCSSPISGPVGSPIFPQQPPVRHTASLHVHPTPHYLPRPSSGEPRSYTSVNLTLRPATCEPQPPIDIRSATSRLTYSTSSYNPIQGFQSQLHIEIGAGCGTISAVRTAAASTMSNPQSSVSSPVHTGGSVKQHQVLVRTVSPSTPDKQLVFSHQQAGLARQMERKAKLESELRREKERLRIMRSEVHTLKDDLNKRQAHKAIAPLRGPQQTTSQRAEQLRIEIRNLQDECKRMTQEVDLHGSQVPLGETDEEFYQNIYTGQRGFVLPPQNLTHPFQGSFTMPSLLPARSNNNNNINSSSSRPATRPAGLNVAAEEEEEEEEDGPHWTCSVCTFRNHPALSKCEQCEMPRISLDVTEAETQDIHIRVTHSNFPSRRVVHSWVV